jgi:hypothetical protein
MDDQGMNPDSRTRHSDDGMNRNFGVVIFDDDKDPGAGWAAVADGEARRISGPDDLPTGTIWWTNMTYEFFFRKTEVWRRSWLRHDKYLVISHVDLLKEWGYDPKGLGADFVCQFAAKVFGRIMSIAFSLVRRIEPRVRMDQVFTGQTLRHDLRRILPEPEYPKGEAASIMKSGQAFEEFTVTGMRPMRDARPIMLRRPRMLYATEMLQAIVPRGPFEHMTRGELRAKSPDRVAWIRDLTEPCMAEISIERMNPEIAPVYGFGNATDRDRKSMRSWVSHPEFIMLARLAEIDVKAAYVGREYASLMLDIPDAVKEFLTDKYNDLSWSAGVIAETLWRATTLPEEKSKVGTLRDGEDRAHTSWQGAWVKAHDKVSMFLVALELAKMGYTVVSYGLGWVRVSVQEEMLRDLINDGLSLGVMPNMIDIAEGMFDDSRPVQWGGDRKSHGLAHYLATRNKDLLWNLDRVPLIHPSKRKDYIANLMAKARRGQI